MTTEANLRVVWKGDLVEGLLAYGLWRGEDPLCPRFPVELWPAGTHTSDWRLFGAGWTVWMWTIRISQWPVTETWEQTLHGTLERMIEAGALIAWCGLEGGFADPPSLFHPEEMSESVYAVLTPSDGFACKARLGEEFSTFENGDLSRLHEIAMAGLGYQ